MAFTEYLDIELGEKKDLGYETRYNCPFCSPNNDFKLYVNSSGTKRDGLWNCKKCGKTGNPISFVMKYNQVGFTEAKDILELYDYEVSEFEREARDLGLSEEEMLMLMIDRIDEPEELKSEDLLVPPPLPTGFKRLVDNLDNPEIIPFIDYLIMKRKFTADDIFMHNIGYIVDGYTTTVQGKKVYLNNHVVFLTHDDNGNYQYWNTRSIEPDPVIKSFNGTALEGEYSKRSSVFNLNVAKHLKEIVIVEGVPDALTIGPEGVGTFGKQVTDEQVRVITKDLTPDQRIYVMLDDDAQEEIVKLASKLYKVHSNTYVVINGTNEDPNDMGREKTWDIIHSNSVLADDVGMSLLFLA